MQLDPVEMNPVLNRLRRARGQLDAVISSIESGQECRVAVHNLATVSRALDRAGFAIISKALQHHLQDTEHPATEDDLKELEKMFLSLA
jgi:DNA-binding FrmR family transcriptional regulator